MSRRSRKAFAPGRFSRLAAGLVALLGLTGLGIQFSASLSIAGSATAALWAMLRSFTVIGNLLAVLVMAAMALGIRAASRPSIIGGITLFMLLIGISYATLLRGMVELSGGAHLADLILHDAMPAATGLYWLFLVRKGGLDSHDMIRWTAVPLGYFAYALARGGLDGRYPYPFMNPVALGWTRTLLNAGAIALGFLLAGAILFWLDQMLGRLSGAARR